MVFKVKQKAQTNYFTKTADSRDDERFKFNFQVGSEGAERESIPDYSYNWPYDFFSLVELVKMSADMSIGDIGGFGKPPKSVVVIPRADMSTVTRHAEATATATQAVQQAHAAVNAQGAVTAQVQAQIEGAQAAYNAAIGAQQQAAAPPAAESSFNTMQVVVGHVAAEAVGTAVGAITNAATSTGGGAAQIIGPKFTGGFNF